MRLNFRIIILNFFQKTYCVSHFVDNKFTFIFTIQPIDENIKIFIITSNRNEKLQNSECKLYKLQLTGYNIQTTGQKFDHTLWTIISKQ